MTKCRKINEHIPVEKKDLTPIKFVKVIDGDLVECKTCLAEPAGYDHIVLLRSIHTGQYDIMYAYNNAHEKSGCIYFGYWNDGVV